MERAKIMPILLILIVSVSGCSQLPTGAVVGDECFPMWQCNEWSSCKLEGNWIETRACNDVNNCPIETGKPKETQECEPPNRIDLEIGENISQCGFNIKLNSVIFSKNIIYTNSENNSEILEIHDDFLFVVPDIEVINNYRFGIKASLTDFEVRDQDNTIFKVRCPNQTQNDVNVCRDGNKWHFGSGFIEPGDKNEGKIIFYVPDSTKELELLYYPKLNSYDCKIVDVVYWKIM